VHAHSGATELPAFLHEPC